MRTQTKEQIILPGEKEEFIEEITFKLSFEVRIVVFQGRESQGHECTKRIQHVQRRVRIFI